MGCSPEPNLVVDGHEFRVERAFVTYVEADDLWWFQVTDGPDPCVPATAPFVTRLYIQNYGGLSPGGPPHPELLQIEVRILSESSDADPSNSPHYYYTSGNEFVEHADDRLRLEFALVRMREGFEGPSMDLPEPIEIELDVPVRICDPL